MTKFTLDDELIRKLAELLEETGLDEIEYEADGRRVRVGRRSGPVAMAPWPLVQPVPGGPSDAGVVPDVAEAIPAGAVLSPMVGTVYTAPEPAAPPFVKQGDTVREGQTLLIIEAMKVMNPLPSPRAGTVTRILVRDGQPVEFGEPLVVVE